MTWQGVPWFVDGATHPPEVARLLAYFAVNGGGHGIAKPGDCRIRELAIPDGRIRVRPGSVAVQNMATGGDDQTYLGRNPSDDLVAITATGSSGGRTDLLYAGIDDPDFPGAPIPADPTVGPYVSTKIVSNVPANTTYWDFFSMTDGDGNPLVGEPLGLVTLPASTGTVLDSMVTDLRRMAAPHSEFNRYPVPTVQGDGGLTLNNQTDGEWFPNGNGPKDIFIPPWAVRAQIQCIWTGIKYPAGSNPWGSMWVEYGPYSSQSHRERSTQKFSYDCASAGNNQRDNWIIGDDVYIPASYRGTVQKFVPLANMAGSYDASLGKPFMTARSGMIMDVNFLEVPDPEAN